MQLQADGGVGGQDLVGLVAEDAAEDDEAAGGEAGGDLGPMVTHFAFAEDGDGTGEYYATENEENQESWLVYLVAAK